MGHPQSDRLGRPDAPVSRKERSPRARFSVPSPAILLLAGVTLLSTYVPIAFGYYGRRATTLWDHVVCLLLLMGSTALILSIGGVIAGLLAAWIGRRTAIALSLAWAVLAVIILRINVILQSTLGNVADIYVPFFWGAGLSSLRWANADSSWLILLARISLQTVVPVAVAIWIAKGVARSNWGRARGWTPGAALLVPLSVIWVSLIVGSLAVMVLPHRSPGAAWLAPRLPLYSRLPVSRKTREAVAIEREATDTYRAEPPLSRVKSIPGLLAPLRASRPTRTPDVLMIILESIRRDALRPEIMPALWGLSRRGVRFDQHSASSCASHEAVFSLLYGLLPLRDELLVANVQPTLPVTLRQAGYDTYFVAGFAHKWVGLTGFTGPRFFVQHIVSAGEEPERDRASIATARELLTTPHDRPRLVVLYVIATHFPYWYPDDAEVFSPAEPLPSLFDITLSERRTPLINRYHNSVRYLDQGLADLLAGIDPTRTVVVATGDHGESFFDDGTVVHMSRLSDAQIDVPLVIVGPGLPAGAERNDPTTHTDIVPTILDLLGYPPAQVAALPGRPLFDAARSPAEFAAASLNDTILLRAPQLRVLFNLDSRAETVQWLGKADVDGESTGRPLRADEQDRVLRWTREFFGRAMHP